MDERDRTDPDAEPAGSETHATIGRNEPSWRSAGPPQEITYTSGRVLGDRWTALEDERSHALQYVGVALVAGTIGAALGVLLAPDSGRNTRRRMGRRIARERQALERQSKRLMAEAEEYIEDKAKEAAHYLERRAKMGARRASHMAGDLADEAKDRLRDARKRVTKLAG